LYVLWSVYEAIVDRRHALRIALPAVAGIATFSVLFGLHAANAAPYIAEASTSGANVLEMLRANTGLSFERRFLAPVSFLGLQWWAVGVAPFAFTLAQVGGWVWAVRGNRQVTWPLFGLVWFWLIFMVWAGSGSSYWGYSFMPLAYAGSGALLGCLVWYGTSGRHPRVV
jgi:hypothetical protein